MSQAAQEAIKYILSTHVMFSVLPNSEKLLILPLFEVKKFADGELIAQQGKPVDGMYLIYSGEARLKQRRDKKILSVGTIGQDVSFGEMSLLSTADWPHDIQATGEVTAIFLPAEPVRALLPQHGVIEEHFKKNVGMIEISLKLRGLLGKAKYTATEFHEILHQLGVKNIRAGKAVFNQGDNDPRLYLIQTGAVDLVRSPIKGDPISLDRVEKGGIIGETGAFDPNGTHAHGATALVDTTVLVIRQEAVQHILEKNVELKDKLKVRIAELTEIEHEELNIRKRAEGLDLRVKLADGVTEDEFRDLNKQQKSIGKFHLIRQNNDTESAAACLAMVCKHYGRDFSVGQVRELTTIDGDKVTPDNIIRGAEIMGFRAKAYSMPFDRLDEMKLPAIIGWEGYHFAVVYAVSDKEVQIADPKGGLKTIKKDKFLPSWSAAQVAGVADMAPDRGLLIALEPTAAFEHDSSTKTPVRHFINYILPYKIYFAEAFLAAIILNVLGLASPLFIQTIVDTVVVHHDAALLNTMLAGMLLVTGLSTIITIVQSILLAHTVARIDLKLMSEFYRHVLSLPMNFFLSRNKGEIMARFGENQKIRAILAGSTITSVLNVIMVVLYFLMMFGYSVTLTWIVIFFIPIYIGIVLFFTPRIKKISQEIFLTNSQQQSHLIESINAIEAIKATSNEYFARARWENSFTDNVNRGVSQQKLGLMSQSLFKLASLGSTVAVLWVGATEVMAGTMSIGELMGFNMLMGLVTAPVLQLVNLWNDMLEVRIAIDRVGEVLNIQPEQPLVTQPEKMPAVVRRLEGRIEFRNVNFSYTTNDKTHQIMRNFNLVMEQGQRVALVGASGCGKSTIAKMVLGFNRITSGELLIDGKNIETMDFYSLRRNIGVVLQDSFIFSGSVAQNIAFGDPAPDMTAVEEAAKLAGAADFIQRYPLGYQTPIGEKGIGISGGQRQRICIARALYRRPKIMIFDEATSALDNESEKQIIEQLEKEVLRGRTSISIAHRLSTIIKSDMICYIGEGRVLEKGNHHELTNPEFLKENGFTGLYYNLARTQFDLPPLDLSKV